jgi:hypothetical protein
MKRSVFYDGVEIYSEHLNYIEESKAEAIKNIVLTFGICGPVRGLVVAPDPNDAYKVMITAGVGYTYGGEYYELTSNVTGVVVSNAIGAKNYICVKVTEVDEYPLPNIVTGEVKYTRKNQRYDVLVLGETDWQNLADKSMYSLLAIVYGSGGFVRGSDIRRAVVIPASLLFVEQQPVVIRGVKVVTVSNNTPLGKGTLGYRYDSIEQKSYLKWKAPNGAGFGTEVAIGGDGVYKLWDQLGVSYLQVEVSVVDLLAESVNEDLQVIDMLEQRELNTGTMVDLLHRSMMGGGMPSIRNPHGQTLDDLEPGEVQDVVKHQRRFHTAGIIGEPGSNTLRPSIASATEIQLQSVAVGEYVVSGGKLYSNIQLLIVDFSGKVSGTYYIYINDEGAVEAKTEGVDDKQYFVICSVSWNGFLLDSNSLVDLRRWGVVTPERVSADRPGDRMLDPHLNVAYDLSDNLAMLRWVLKAILGGTSWYDIPDYTLKDLQDAYTHIGLSYLSGAVIHGVKLGHAGELDADKLDGKHLSEILDGTVANADKLDGVHKDTGHTIDGSGINADMLDGKHLSEITVRNADYANDSDKLDGQHGSYYLSRANHTDTQAPSTISPQGHGSGLDADKLDGFHASQTPAANVIPVTLDTGMLPLSWFDIRYVPHYRVTVDTTSGNRSAPDNFFEAATHVWRYPSFGGISWTRHTDWGVWSTLWQMKIFCDSAISVSGTIGRVDNSVYIYLNNHLVISKGTGTFTEVFTLFFNAGDNLLQIVHNNVGSASELEIWLDLPWSLSFRFVYMP